jgi:hypothetical protein
VPRGNDAQAAYAELTDKFGQGAGKAEDMVAASRQRYTDSLRAAQVQEVDQNATALLDDADVAEALNLKGDQKIVSTAVRGAHVVAVIEAADGRVRKEELPRSAFDVGEAEEVTDTPFFSSDAAEKFADDKNLTPEIIGQYVAEGSGAKGTYTKQDVAKAAAARAEAKG